jgi:hypothetical protein
MEEEVAMEEEVTMEERMEEVAMEAIVIGLCLICGS